MSTEIPTILVVDDEADLRDALKTGIEYQNFRVCTAGDGEEGLKVAFAEKPQLILLDLTMPKMDGLTMLKKLKEDPWGKTVKVIVMTALDDLTKVAEVIEAGGDEYVVKTTVTLEGIVGKIKTKLGVT